jgi:hypothetical protein
MDRHRAGRVRPGGKHLRGIVRVDPAQHLTAGAQDGSDHARLDQLLAVHSGGEPHVQLATDVDVQQGRYRHQPVQPGQHQPLAVAARLRVGPLVSLHDDAPVAAGVVWCNCAARAASHSSI